MDEINKEIFSKYSEDVLNYLSDMDDNDRANFLHHMEEYSKNFNRKIDFDKLESGESIPQMISDKKDILEKLKKSALVSAFFSIWSGISIANIGDTIEIMNKYNNDFVKQILLAANQVLPISCAGACIILTFDYLHNYNLCNDTLNTYKRVLK